MNRKTPRSKPNQHKPKQQRRANPTSSTTRSNHTITPTPHLHRSPSASSTPNLPHFHNSPRIHAKSLLTPKPSSCPPLPPQTAFQSSFSSNFTPQRINALQFAAVSTHISQKASSEQFPSPKSSLKSSPFHTTSVLTRSKLAFSTNPDPHEPTDAASAQTVITSTTSSSPATPILNLLADDVVAQSIPKPRHSTDENQYKINQPWVKPTEKFDHLSDEQKHEIKERFALENTHRMHNALSKLRSTKGTMALGTAQGSDNFDGSMPQRNGSMSENVLNSFDRAEKYKKQQQMKKQQQLAKQLGDQLRKEQQAEFAYDPKALEADFGLFSSKTDSSFKRQSTPEETEKHRTDELLGKNWMSRWF